MTSHLDRYADGTHISPRRRQKAAVLADVLAGLLPGRNELTLVDFGCADGAIPVLMLESPFGATVERYIGLTKLDYNDLAEKPAFAHLRFTRIIADLAKPLDDPALPWGACDAVTATAFLHYFAEPTAPLALAARLLKPGGWLVAGMPACWVLGLRRRGVPGVLARNNYIRTVQSLDAWRAATAAQGLHEEARFAIQWLGVGATGELEHWLAGRRLPAWCGTNALVIYRKEESSCI